MANSLMELYGGGMVGKSNNYQLGGRIAGARRSREYQGEMRELERKQRDAARRKKKSGFLGSLGAIAGGALGAALAPVTGGASLAIGAGLGKALGESTYGREDYSGGKYAQDTRGELREVEDDYRKGIGERALVTGLQAAIMPGVYEKAGSWLKGLGGAGEAATTASDITGAVPDFAPAAPVHEGMAASGLQLPGMPELGATPSMAMEGFGSGMAGKLGGMPTTVASTIAPEAASTVASTVAPAMGQASGLGFGEIAPDVMSYAPSEEWFSGMDSMTGYDPLSNFGPTSLFPRRGGGMIPKMQAGGGIFGGGPVFGPGTDWSMQGSNLFGIPGQGIKPQMTGAGGTFNPSAGYGTATGAMGALRQMGMGDIANDPRLQKYLEDLPQFSMGYEQKVGDYRTGAQQGLLGLAQAGASGAGGFAGSGAATTQSQQQRQQMVDQFGRQRRGVVEGYQADVLSAIGDIERKGEFEFGISAKDYEQTEGAMAKLRQQKGMLGKLFSNVSDEKLREMLQSSQG